MKLYPLNVIDFQEMFPNDQACFAYLCLVKWPEGFKCASCEAQEYWKVKPYRVMCKNCRKKQSVIAGTVFQDLHLPLHVIFQAMWYVVCQKNGVSALGLKSILGLGSYEIAWAWLHKLRTAMVRLGRDKLSGTVEVDETFVGGEHEGKRGRGAQGRELVLVAVEYTDHGMGRIRFKHIPNASSKTLEDAVAELVTPESVVRTDG